MVSILLCLIMLQIVCLAANEISNNGVVGDGLTQLQQQQKEANMYLRGSEEKMLNLQKTDNIKNENNVIKMEIAGTVVNENDIVPISRTATGGFVNTILVFLTVFAFLGNGAFMVYVFWLSKSS